MAENGPWNNFGQSAGSAPQAEPQNTPGPWNNWGKSEAKQKYDAALAQLRSSPQFRDWPEDKFQEYAKFALQPYGLTEIGQNASTLGLGDEISATASALSDQLAKWFTGKGQDFGPAWQMWQQMEAARRDLGKEQAGDTGNLMNLVGGIMSGGPLNPAAIVSAAPKTLAGKVAQGAGIGGTYGAVSGAASTDGDWLERLKGAGIGGGTGAVIGGALPIFAAGAEKVYDKFFTDAARRKAARDIGIQPEGVKVAVRTMSADDTLSPAGVARMDAAGPNAMLLDAGPSAQQVVDTAIQKSGKAGALARDAIDARVQSETARLSQTLDDVLGKPLGVDTARANISQATSSARKQLYNVAYSKPIDYASGSGTALEDLLSRVPDAAIRTANKLMQINGEKSGQILASVADDGTVIFKTLPDVRQIDYITRALREEAKNGIGQGAMGGQTAIGAALDDLASNIRSVLGSHIPEYRLALDVAGDTIGNSKAVKLGYDLLSSNMSREDVAREVGRLSKAEQQNFAQGIRSRIDDVIANVTKTNATSETEVLEAVKALKLLSSRANREKIAIAIGDDQATRLFSVLDEAAKTFELRNRVQNNSLTFARSEMNNTINSLVRPDNPVGALTRGEPVNAAKFAVQTMFGQTPARQMAKEDEILRSVVELMTRPAASGKAALQRLSLQSLIEDEIARNAALKAAGIRATTVPLSYLGTTQLEKTLLGSPRR